MKNELRSNEYEPNDEIAQKPDHSKEPKKKLTFRQKYSLETLKNRIKHLNGDPHYVAKGMAIGVFIAVTPTIPFHMVLALLMAIVLKASKPAAIIGCWFANPITIPIFYLASYKVGAFIIGHEMPFDLKYDSILELTKVGLDVTIAMLLGGFIIGIIPAVPSYFITKNIIMKYRKKREKKKAKPLLKTVSGTQK